VRFTHVTAEKASGKIDGRHGRSRGHAQMSKREAQPKKIEVKEAA